MPNMFRCVLASGGALILTVTCDSEFAGQTITCTDGTTTLTQSCPSSSPYTVEFKIPNAGTWLISSGTDSISIIIPDTADLHHIPTGSTITPTDDIQTWLNCGNIWDKTYTTISEVLNDSTTLTALVASNNAADYMARSITWASSVVADSSAMIKIGVNNYCSDKLLANSTWLNAICGSPYFESILNAKVPTMTSNTAPSGVASCDPYRSVSFEPYKSFDGTDQSGCVTNGTSGSIQYQYTQNVNVRLVTLKEYNKTGTVTVNSLPKNITFKVSDDGSSFTDVGTGTISTATQNQKYTFKLPNNTYKKKYFRMYASNNNGQTGYTQWGSILQFYGRKDV